MFKKIITLSTLLTAALAQTVGPAVTIKDLRLFYGNDEFFIKGIGYSPSPMEKYIVNQGDGTGWCTPHVFPVPTTYTTATTSPCGYDDYFDSTSYPGGPPNGYTSFWARDFPEIVALGANAIRIYHVMPVTQLSIQNDPLWTDKTVLGANHIPFMDAAAAHNLKVVFPLWSDETTIGLVDPKWVQYYIRTLIDEVGYHPALIMYQFGNELQYYSNGQAYLDKVNGYIQYARNYQQQKWGRSIPITSALVDDPSAYPGMASGLQVDIMTSNSGYRGFTFSNFWSDPTVGWFGLSCKTGIPTMVGEMGVHLNTPVFNVPSWFPQNWQDLVNNKISGAIGGFLFEWQDEEWKGVSYKGEDISTLPDVRMGVVTLSAGSGSGTYVLQNINRKSGGAYDWNSVVQGFSANPYAVAGPAQLSTVTNDYCVLVPIVYTCAAGCGAACSCGGACYSQDNYCCLNGGLQPLSNCPATQQKILDKNSQGPTSMAGNPPTTPSSTSAAPTSAAASTTSAAPTSAVPATSSSDCQAMFASLKCRTISEDPAQINATLLGSTAGWLCGTYPQYCTSIVAGGQYASCNSAEKMSFAMNQYYAALGTQQGASACDFGGLGKLVTVVTPTSATPTSATPTSTTAAASNQNDNTQQQTSSSPVLGGTTTTSLNTVVRQQGSAGMMTASVLTLLAVVVLV